MKINSHWTSAIVTALRDITPTVREFTIQPADGPAETHAPGSHLQVQVPVNGAPQLRTYSLVGEPDRRFYRIAVKRMDEGRGGSLAMWKLTEGDSLQVGAPINNFPLDFTAPAYLLVAGGIGVTPLVLMAQALARRGANVRMVYGVRSNDEMAYGDELRDCLGDALYAAAGVPVDFDREIAALAPGAQMYVCGPVPMLDAARHAWDAAGRASADLRYETFGSSGRFPSQPFRVRVPRHDLDIVVPADCSLLDALEKAGVQTLHDCKRGECGLCAVDVIAVEGSVDHRDVYLSEHEKQENRRICACVSRVVGSVTLDSAWRPDFETVR
ncbi:MAG TPA: PDR/VanB family oxidoreductase [Ramlibacter sp.]|nr:PDR/VanB family oxidoreductase [Ramlibacter sp.]